MGRQNFLIETKILQVVQREIDELPSFMTECAMIYVPHIGYLLAVQPWWNQDQQPPDVDNFESEFLNVRLVVYTLIFCGGN